MKNIVLVLSIYEREFAGFTQVVLGFVKNSIQIFVIWIVSKEKIFFQSLFQTKRRVLAWQLIHICTFGADLNQLLALAQPQVVE